MRYLKSFTQINETLKSDTIEIVSKKLSNFFDNLGFHKREDFFMEAEPPNYQIVSDRDYMKKRILDYTNPTKDFKKLMKKHNVDPERMIKSLQQDLNEFQYGDIYIFADKNTPEITNSLIHLIDSMGYFIATAGNREDKIDKSQIKKFMSSSDKISISIEPKYDLSTYDQFDGEYLYHTTNKNNLNKILKHGLVPKSKNTRSFYPERIYLSPDSESNKSIQNQLSSDKPGDYITLKIKKFPELKLYKDVRFKSGFYTYNNIPPKYIEVLN